MLVGSWYHVTVLLFQIIPVIPLSHASALPEQIDEDIERNLLQCCS